MAEPVPITRAIGQAIEAARTADVDRNALDANPAAKARRAKSTMDIQTAQSTRKIARAAGVAELKELANSSRDSEAVAEITKAAAIDIGLRLMGGEFPYKDAGQAASVMKMLMDMHRLERGQATSIHSEITMDDVQREMAKMRERVQARIQSGADPLGDDDDGD